MSPVHPAGPLTPSPGGQSFTDSQFTRTFGAGAPPLGVLHVVGYLTEAVFDILGPTCAALHAEGRQQSLLVLEDSTLARLSQRFNTSLEVHPLTASRSFVNTWFRMGQALQTMVNEGKWQAIYLHGLMPFVISAPLIHHIRSLGTRVLLSPHSSRSLRSMKLFAQPVLWGLHRFLPMAGIETIASVPFDVRAMKRLVRVSARLIEPPVDEVFFSVTAQQEPATPICIVGGAPFDARGAAQRFAQFAVLLPGSLPEARFIWIGSASAEDRAVLKASGIETLASVDHEMPDAYERAKSLANGSMYIACGDGRGFAMGLAEALAVGLPCLCLNPDGQSDIIVHNETGLICRTVEEMAIRSINLVQSPEVRAKLAEQGRREAVLRFSDQEFRRHIVALFSSYEKTQRVHRH